MLALVLQAVRARAAQALTVLILTALAAAVAVAGPWYAIAGASAAAVSDVEHAPADQRVVSVRQTGAIDDPADSLAAFADAAERVLALPAGGPAPVRGVAADETVLTGGANEAVALAYRDDFCGHATLTGTCPERAGDVAVSADLARVLRLAVGSTIDVGVTPSSDPLPLRVTATYDVVDPAGPYWGNRPFGTEQRLDPVFTVLETFADPLIREPRFMYDVELPRALLRGEEGDLAAVLANAARAANDASEMRLIDPTGPLLQTIAADRTLVRDGVLVALVQVLVLSWFAMGLAGRYTGRERRADAALLKLRGSRRRRILGLAFGQHLVPLLGGTLLGVPLGVALAWALVGPVEAAERTSVLVASALGAAAVLLGGLLTLAAVELMTLRLPVAQLLRRVPDRRRSWRADVFDLALLAIAVAAVYQTRTGDPGRGLALVAPGLVALAVALLLARLLSRAADAAGAVALRGGRLRLGLTAVRISRQPGTDRVFALVTVAVALFVTAGGLWSAGRQARTDRAEVEVGAARVLTVTAANATALLDAVRTADPGGRDAMAVVSDPAAVPPLVAVDSERLGAVANWRPEYGDVATLARSLSTDVPAAPAITGDTLTARVRNDGAKTVRFLVTVQQEATGAVITEGATLPRGTHTLTVRVRGCAEAPGCRLTRWEVARYKPAVAPPSDTAAADPPPELRKVTLLGLRQQDPDQDVLDAAALGDARRWRGDFTGTPTALSAAPGALTVTLTVAAADDQPKGGRVSVVDSTLPVPVLLAGTPPREWLFEDPSVSSLADSVVPVRVAGRASALPVVGGSGVLTDLGTARRIGASAASRGISQVWLSPGAPAGLVPALQRAGLTVTGDTSVTAEAGQLAEQGVAQAARFALIAAAAGVLLAAAAVAVATASDRGPHLDQLRALRVQGLSARSAVVVGYAAGVALVLTGVLAGLAAALLARPLARTDTPMFTDSWSVVPPPGALSAAALLGTGAVCLLVLTVTGGLSLLPLHRALREGRR
ncbi:FtsX-like permease family protein [Actinoplanes sp. RD1]|uniref:FtsX-like permease family protein n=1 Tax=Actinoplanes sp. RD1 TaxID=3064538 RepID=UPI002740A557|nr:FtsX-like permease family protein [Actinoplanes sp. RD1]